MFSLTSFKSALDWYHLVEKFRELYGMAFRCKEIAIEYLGTIKPLPWRSNMDGAKR
jgi:hypothetical protein